jgi:hypothetical protein
MTNAPTWKDAFHIDIRMEVIRSEMSQLDQNHLELPNKFFALDHLLGQLKEERAELEQSLPPFLGDAPYWYVSPDFDDEIPF